ncbi:polysaccharide export outer membrane protein [Palleronia aestuarii]|uniref:Polysaccharide export outer membrane protein n=1 Tax=Palleronia aestuarii TaxID=568105 RepID=A0A2W7NYB8_9RHOB|nr:polysaccharide biosynthesis/export family protein [Palleronia aestuarii]PZX18276.1 polysaccharide export outer membrane protein [Palleronia aestuarii]
MTISRASALLLCALTGLTACSGLPRGAALKSEIRRDAAAEEGEFAFYPVTRGLLPTLAAWPAINAERSAGWPRQSAGSDGQIIAAGDTVVVRIWDSSDNSLLTSIEQRSAELGPLTVSSAGRVFVPYVGEVRIAGMSPERAREAIQNELTQIAPSAQVQLALEEGNLNSVAVVDGVGRPGTYPLVGRNVSILSVLSEAGGVNGNLRNPRVKLQRGGTLYATSLDSLYENPARDALVRAGDRVIVEEDERFFLSLGAAGREAIVNFPQDELTALEAISLIGGITDTRADPEGVLVLREYPPSALATGLRGPRQTRVIFSIDLTTADGLFSAQNMQIMPKDVVLATESPVSSIQLAIGLLAGGVGLATRVTN